MRNCPVKKIHRNAQNTQNTKRQQTVRKNWYSSFFIDGWLRFTAVVFFDYWLDCPECLVLSQVCAVLNKCLGVSRYQNTL